MSMQHQSVTILGLGHVGLPLAALIASSGFAVRGIDINEEVITKIESGSRSLHEPGLQSLVQQMRNKGYLAIATQPSYADIYIIAVPTLLSPQNKPDISQVQKAIADITPFLKNESLILIESTCPIGTTQAISCELKKCFPGISVCYCPERILPGNALHELMHNDRIVGGIDPNATNLAAAFYQQFTQGRIWLTNAKTAEAVKLAENAFRDVNIAFANELSMIANHIQIDVREVIELANRHPRVNILNPGVGVGGHCIGMDPWYLVDAAPELAHLTTTARLLNTKKTEWVIQQVRATAHAQKAKAIACLGLTYKADVADTRESPAMKIVQALENEFAVLRVDPFVPETSILSHALMLADLIVSLVPHTAFRSIKDKNVQNKTILDFAGIFYEKAPDCNWHTA